MISWLMSITATSQNLQHEKDEKWPGAQEVLDRIKDIYDYQGDGWQVITPKTLMDIVDDSHQLHHCAGASERYYERIQREETYILFLLPRSKERLVHTRSRTRRYSPPEAFRV